MRLFLHSILILAIGTVHAFGAYATVEITHSHELNAHHHDHHGHSHGHEHHSHDHHGHEHAPAQEPADSSGPSDSHEDEGNSTGHEHTHTKTLGADAPLVIQDCAQTNSLFSACTSMALLGRDSRPDQPCYSVIKPPQLG